MSGFAEWLEIANRDENSMVYRCERSALEEAYNAGLVIERERLQPYIKQLEQSWLALTSGKLQNEGMKVDQARIHAQARLAEAKQQILADATNGGN